MKTSARVSPDDPKILKLADYLCFTIYSANLAMAKAYKPVLDELGLTYTQYITVIALWEEDNQTVSSLGDKLFLESNTLTPILKKLEVMGYVRRQRLPNDERHVRVGLTQAGYRLRESALGKNLLWETGIPAEEASLVQRMLATIRNNLLKVIKRRA
jgi:MarR family transcriptional regulator, organic hydroperoxide resistance regulator